MYKPHSNTVEEKSIEKLLHAIDYSALLEERSWADDLRAGNHFVSSSLSPFSRKFFSMVPMRSGWLCRIFAALAYVSSLRAAREAPQPCQLETEWGRPELEQSKCCQILEGSSRIKVKELMVVYENALDCKKKRRSRPY